MISHQGKFQATKVTPLNVDLRQRGAGSALRSQWSCLQHVTELVNVTVTSTQPAPLVHLKCCCTVTVYFMLNILPQTIPDIVFKYKQEWEWKENTDAPWLTMGLHPNKPIVSWKYCQSKMHLIYLNYWMSQLSLAYLRCAQTTIPKKHWQHSTLQSVSCFPLWLRGDWELTATVWHHEGQSYCISLALERSKFKVQF